jgi:hypothetical protein
MSGSRPAWQHPLRFCGDPGLSFHPMGYFCCFNAIPHLFQNPDVVSLGIPPRRASLGEKYTPCGVVILSFNQHHGEKC